MSNEAVIVDVVRTASGRGKPGGALAGVQKFILLGDDSQKDIDIYSSIVEHFPQNVYCVYIRRVGTPEKPHVLLKQQTIEKKGVLFCYFSHSEEAILHSKKIGLIK